MFQCLCGPQRSLAGSWGHGACHRYPNQVGGNAYISVGNIKGQKKKTRAAVNMEPQCEACRRRREQRRLRHLHRYSTDEAYRHEKLKAGNEAYRKNPDLGRARSYLRHHQQGRIRSPNADLLTYCEAVVRASGSKVLPLLENGGGSVRPTGEEAAMAE